METADLKLPGETKIWNSPRFPRQNGVLSKLPDALFGDSDPDIFFVREKPVHRQMAEMARMGYTTVEIAACVGQSAGNVSRSLRQPFARRHMIEATKQDVTKEMRDFLDAEVMPTLRVIKSIRDDPNTKPEAALTASNMLLDRRFGRPTQPIEDREKPVDAMTPAEIEARALKILERERSENPGEVPVPPEGSPVA